MDLKTFDAFREEFHREMESIVAVKNPDYSVTADTMSNYKEIARLIGIPARVVWSVLFLKHVTAICKYVRDEAVCSEPIRGRFLDAANYCMLGAALVSEDGTEEREDVKRAYTQPIVPVSPGQLVDSEWDKFRTDEIETARRYSLPIPDVSDSRRRYKSRADLHIPELMIQTAQRVGEDLKRSSLGGNIYDGRSAIATALSMLHRDSWCVPEKGWKSVGDVLLTLPERGIATTIRHVAERDGSGLSWLLASFIPHLRRLNNEEPEDRPTSVSPPSV